VRVFDQQGNVIEVHDWQGNPLNDSIRSARVIERRKAGQFRLTPALFWAIWGTICAAWVVCLTLLGLAMVAWSMAAVNAGWALGVGGVIVGVASFFGMVGMSEYYKHHGVPKTFKEPPKELYCKKCQAKLEEELNVANEQRREELLAELKQLGVNLTPALEAAKDTVFEESGKVKEQWRPPREDPFDRGKR